MSDSYPYFSDKLLVNATAQQRAMLDQILRVLDVEPDCDLTLMIPGETLSQLTANLLTRLDSLMAREKPDWVLVHSDTTTVMVASLVAFYHRVRVGHVKAGLRTGDKWQPSICWSNGMASTRTSKGWFTCPLPGLARKSRTIV